MTPAQACWQAPAPPVPRPAGWTAEHEAGLEALYDAIAAIALDQGYRIVAAREAEAQREREAALEATG